MSLVGQGLPDEDTFAPTLVTAVKALAATSASQATLDSSVNSGGRLMVDRLKKKKDGSLAYKDECQGVGLNPPDGGSVLCDGEVSRFTREATSFGQPFTTSAYLCDAHAAKFGYAK
jgi:hypothetical protein